MSDQPEALRLADALTAEADCNCCASNYFECVCDAIWPEQWVDNAASELRRLHKALHDIYEVWAGSEGIPVPQTAPEAYLLSLVEHMRYLAKEGLK